MRKFSFCGPGSLPLPPVPLPHPVIFSVLFIVKPDVSYHAASLSALILFLFFLYIKGASIFFFYIHRAVCIAVFCGSANNWSGMRMGRGGEGGREGVQILFLVFVCLFFVCWGLDGVDFPFFTICKTSGFFVQIPYVRIAHSYFGHKIDNHFLGYLKIKLLNRLYTLRRRT